MRITITKVETYESGFIKKVKYLTTLTKNEVSVSRAGYISFEDSDTFKPLDSITVSDVENWVLDAMGEDGVSRQSDLLKTLIDQPKRITMRPENGKFV